MSHAGPVSPRRAVLGLATGLLLAAPTVLAFFTGGYFPNAQAWAGIALWVLLAVAVLVAPGRLPVRRESWMTVAGLTLLGAWTLISITWAPIAGSAYRAGLLVMIYVGALAAALWLLGTAWGRRTLEPALAKGALIVVGYGVAGRLVPGALHFAHSVSARGRLEQPLTYWNAMGELAALGFVLTAALAGNVSRSRGERAVSAAAAAPLGLGLYLSFSRGALFACFAGLVALIVLGGRRERLEGVVLSVGAGVLAAAAAAPFHGVTSLSGSLSTRERQGAIVLVLLAVIAGLAGAVQWRLARGGRSAPLRLPRGAGWVALLLICGGLALAIVVGAKEGTQAPLSPGASRYVTLESNRYDYWKVALRAFGDEPVRGVGAGGWAVWWLRYRPIRDFARDAHSLPLQTMAELGLVGLGLLLTFFGGVALAARRAWRLRPEWAAGPAAGFVAYAAHAPLDWDWQMPAVTLVAILLAGGLLALGEDLRALTSPGPAASGSG